MAILYSRMPYLQEPEGSGCSGKTPRSVPPTDISTSNTPPLVCLAIEFHSFAARQAARRYLSLTWWRIGSEQQSPIKEELDELCRRSRNLHNTHATLFVRLVDQLSQTVHSLQLIDERRKTDNQNEEYVRQSLVEINERIDGWLHLSLKDSGGTVSQETDQRLSDLVHQVQGLSSLLHSMPRENSVLRKLYFQSVFRRENDVLDPTENTFNWIYGERDGLNEPLQDTETRDTHLALMSGSHETVSRHEMSRSFIQFLRQDGKTYLITGKAGCGKSTFMKYVAHHPKTNQHIKAWAGGAKLVIVRLFFWQSDDHFQGSIEGFWRSILFQVLSQCPELISQVFPQQQTDSENISDAVEFQAPELEVALSRLMEIPNPESYRFVYFIDGLDEHQGDNLSHANMANLLASWASRLNFKMVCSCRPYTVFLDTFRETGVIVELHKLTWSDISSFAESKFKQSLSRPKMLDAQRNCIALVNEITTRAEGVFLWASITVRALINQALEHDGEEHALRLRLQQCPDSLEALFQQMLSRVEETDRIQRRSNMVLYLAVHNPFESPLNALIYSWLDELEWFEESKSLRMPLPAGQFQETYSEKQICSRKDRVVTLLNQLTKGLVEVVSTDNPILYLEYRVDLYHRSVREFLKDAWRLGSRTNPFPNPSEELMVFCRLRILEARGISLQGLSIGRGLNSQKTAITESLMMNQRHLFDYTFIWLAACYRNGNPPPSDYLLEFQDALDQAQSILPDFILGSMLIDGYASWRYHSEIAYHKCDFLHWAAYWNLGNFVRENSPPKVFVPENIVDISLLLSSSVAGDADTTRFLLSHNHPPHERILITDCQVFLGFHGETSDLRLIGKLSFAHAPTWKRIHPYGGHRNTGIEECATIWAVFLRDFANNVRTYCWKRLTSESWPLYLDSTWNERLSHVIEAYLTAGADPSACFLLLFKDSKEVHEVDLFQMLDVVKPDNLSSLTALLSERIQWQRDYGRRSLVVQPDPSSMQRANMTSMLLNKEWRVLGVFFSDGGVLMGSFKVRVF